MNHLLRVKLEFYNYSYITLRNFFKKALFETWIILFSKTFLITLCMLQWNLDWAKCQGTGEICSLYVLYRKPRFNEF